MAAEKQAKLPPPPSGLVIPPPLEQPKLNDPMMPLRLPGGLSQAAPISQEEPQLNATPIVPVPKKQAPMRPDGSDVPRINDGSRPPPNIQSISHREPIKRQLVNSTKIFLDYQVENAVAGARVEVWLTRDMGKSWQKYAEDAQRRSPVEVTLPGEGTFGVTLQVTNGRPGAAPDSADAWIEVDLTKPSAQFTKVDVVRDNGQATVHIHWSAQDQNLGDGPVELVYGATPQGPWLPIAKGLKADGQFAWTPTPGIGAQAHIQMIVRDAAGNMSIASTTEPVQFG